MKAMMILTLLIAAVYFDLKTDKVPNELIVLGYLIGALTQIHAPPDVRQFIVSVVWPIALLYPLFLIRGLGAGDIKLFSVLSVFYSPAILMQIMIFSLFIGAAVCFCNWIVCQFVTRTITKSYIHYTVCILFSFLFQFIWEAMA